VVPTRFFQNNIVFGMAWHTLFNTRPGSGRGRETTETMEAKNTLYYSRNMNVSVGTVVYTSIDSQITKWIFGAWLGICRGEILNFSVHKQYTSIFKLCVLLYYLVETYSASLSHFFNFLFYYHNHNSCK
jgi:hypothetical protein